MQPIFQKKRVLIVDDVPIIANTLSMIFEVAGYDSRHVGSAEDAVQLISEWAPQLAILDVRLPGMNGVDLAILLKAELPDCRVLLFSGHPNTHELLESANRDGHRFKVLAKPVPPTQLLAEAARLFPPPSTVPSEAAPMGQPDPGDLTFN